MCFFRLGFSGIALHYPTVMTGDEPHYLVVINSLLQDADLDVANNYRGALSGGRDAGFWFRNYPLDQHVVTARNGHRYSYHPVGMPLIIAALTFPFRGTRWVEPLAVMWCTAATLLGLVLAGKVLERSGRPDLAGPAVLLGGLATPVFAYARGLWAENLVLLGFFSTLWLWSQNRARWLSALIVALTIFCRYPAGVLFAAIFLVGVWFRKRGTVAVGLGGIGGALAILLYNRIFFSNLASIYSSAQAPDLPNRYVLGNFVVGLVGNLFHPMKGLLVFSPVLVFGFVGLIWWLRQRELLAAVLCVTVVLQFAVISLYRYWLLGSSFGNRYLYPVMIPLAIGCIEFWKKSSSRYSKAIFLLLLTYSAAISLYGGFLPGAVYERTPVGIVSHIVERFPMFFRSVEP
ncbi:MAG: hypothetical protein HY644_01235 [Acidobacteria bacterium]|nr:hypothetical protein [Acidobacteriota bacterium]